MLSRCNLSVLSVFALIIPSPQFTSSERTQYGSFFPVSISIRDNFDSIFPIPDGQFRDPIQGVTDRNCLAVTSRRISGGYLNVAKTHPPLNSDSTIEGQNFINTGPTLLINWYLERLETNPIVTKAVTAGVISGLGDILSQVLERALGSHDVSSSIHDVRRTIAVSAECIFISAPIQHLAYDFMEEMIPITDTDGIWVWIATVIQVAIDTFIMDSFFVLTAILFSGIFEGQSLMKQIIPQIHEDYFPSLKASWASSFMLLPIQLLAFRYFPVTLRVLAMNCQDIIWSAVVSFMVHRSRRGQHAL